eukprot:5945756-Prorocentrum_lima.AAC.1
MLDGHGASVTVRTQMELNKALRFYKQNGDVGFTFDHISDDTKDWLMVGFSAASWGTRPDGSSQ